MYRLWFTTVGDDTPILSSDVTEFSSARWCESKIRLFELKTYVLRSLDWTLVAIRQDAM